MEKNIFSSAKIFLIYKTKLSYYISVTLAVIHYYCGFNRATTKASKISKIVNSNVIFCLKGPIATQSLLYVCQKCMPNI